MNLAVRSRRDSQIGRLKFRESRRCGDAGCDQVIRPSLGQELGSVRSPRRLPSSLESSGLSRSPGFRPSRLTGRSNSRTGNSRTHQTSDQERLPAEFKHITKRRRRN